MKVLVKDCNIRLTGSSKKGKVMDRILAMARIGVIRRKHDGDDDEVTGISYITDEALGVLRTLPLFSKVTEWSKELGEKLTDFTLVNIIVYLVYGQDKTFIMHALRAYKSLKDYKFFYDGFEKTYGYMNSRPVPFEGCISVPLFIIY